MAGLLRTPAGEASLLVSQSITAGQLSPEAHLKYLKFVGGIDIAWNALQLTASGMALPPALAAAIEANKTAYFESEYVALRDRLVTTLMSGGKPELTANQWTPITVGRLSAAVKVAEAALAAAKHQTPAQHPAALRPLVMQLALLIVPLAFTFRALNL